MQREWTAAELDEICPIPPLPHELPRVISRADALARGISRQAISRRLAAKRWRRILPHVYQTVDTLTSWDKLSAAVAFAGEGAALSGTAALYAEQVRRVAMPARVLVLVPASNRTRSFGWAQVRSTQRPIVLRQWSGPRRVETARAAADAALAMTRLDDVRTVVARVVRDRHCTVAELAAELDAGPRQGSAHLRRALVEVGWGAGSAPEAKAARILRRAGIDGWRLNVTIALPDGTERELDVYWDGLRAGLEIDSREFHVEPQDWTGTWDKHLELAVAGLSTIHRMPSALDDPARFVSDVRRWLDGRRADLQRGLPSPTFSVVAPHDHHAR